jgi:hypothetical protein
MIYAREVRMMDMREAGAKYETIARRFDICLTRVGKLCRRGRYWQDMTSRDLLEHPNAYEYLKALAEPIQPRPKA